MDFHRTWRELEDLAFARDVVRTLACNLYGGETRWDLFQRAGETRQKSPNALGAGALARACSNAALGVVSIPLLPPPHGKNVGFSTLHYKGNCLGGLSKCDRQNAGGKRIQGAGVAGTFGLK